MRADPRQIDWRFGVGRNRMSWLARPTHWMVVNVMRPWDGSASWTEKSHYLAIGPLRLFVEPRLRSEAWLARQTWSEKKQAGGSER